MKQKSNQRKIKVLIKVENTLISFKLTNLQLNFFSILQTLHFHFISWGFGVLGLWVFGGIPIESPKAQKLVLMKWKWRVESVKK